MKTAVFLLLNEYADWEGAYLSSQLNQLTDWTVKIASIQKNIHSIGGFQTKADYSINEIPLETELLVLIGGNSWHINSLEITNLIKNRLVAGKTVASICGAVDFLAKNGLLNDKKHTGNSVYLWQSYEQYTNLSRFLEEQVVVDEPLITANGTATLEFTNQVMKTVHALPVDQIDKTTNLYKLGFYKYCDKFGNPYA